MEAAERIVDDVRERGDVAVREHSLRLDGSCPEEFRVPGEVIEGALDLVDEEFLSALRLAARQIRDFHERERERSWFTTRADGTVLGVQVMPVRGALPCGGPQGRGELSRGDAPGSAELAAH